MSSFIGLRGWLNWASSSKKSTCNFRSLGRLVSLDCLPRTDDNLFWWGCCSITFYDRSFSSFSCALVHLICDKDRKLFRRWIIFFKRSSWFFIVITLVLTFLMAKWHGTLNCVKILSLSVFCRLAVAVERVEVLYWGQKRSKFDC